VFHGVLERARRAVRNRETLRLARSRGYGLIRGLYRELGTRLRDASVIDDANDVFLLTTEEVAGAVRGASTIRDLRAVVALRRSEQEAFLRMRPASRVVARGLVAAAEVEQESAGRASVAGELRGISCSAGKVRARAKVIHDPRGARRIDGEILVATMTDPGWVFLMVAAAGLVVERGSVLSHTAIIGRELGIPTVVGVTGATRRIPEGAMLSIDGARGIVTIES
jgi:pyruvate,water dikinase